MSFMHNHTTLKLLSSSRYHSGKGVLLTAEGDVPRIQILSGLPILSVIAVTSPLASVVATIQAHTFSLSAPTSVLIPSPTLQARTLRSI